MCDAALIAALGSAAATAARTRSSATLENFYRANAASTDEAMGTVDACLNLCLVDGYTDFRGLGELYENTFIDGEALVPLPAVDFENPDDELLARMLDAYGTYSASDARAVAADEWRRIGGPLCDWEPAAWAAGHGLLAAALRVEQCEQALPSGELRDALSKFRETLRRAAASSHAVVEWVEKN